MTKLTQVLLLSWILMPFAVLAQATFNNDVKDSGINFVKNMSWEQIKVKAKAENKYIFLDCYTTWCGPCKRMEDEVYGKYLVGDYLNENFISVKVQIDKTKNDDFETQRWYSDADSICKKYRVKAFPTYLFFSPEGIILEKKEGFKQIGDFIGMAKGVIEAKQKFIDPYEEYDKLIAKFRSNIKEYDKFPYLIKTAKELNDKDLENCLKNAYYDYLRNLRKKDLYKVENIEFLASIVKSSKDKYFTLFFSNSSKVDEIMNQKGFAQRVVDRVIWLEFINPFIEIYNVSEPNWDKLFRILKKKYSIAQSERSVLSAKVRWYEYIVYKNGWNTYVPLYIKYFIEQEKRYGISGINISLSVPANGLPYEVARDLTLNDVAWKIFQFSNDKDQIYSALNWMECVLKSNKWTPPFAPIDTYANLLYKVGRKDDALRLEEKIVKDALEIKDQGAVRKYQAIVDKMKKGVPTWPK